MAFFSVIMHVHAVLQEQGMHYTLLCTTHLLLHFFYNHVQLHLIFTTNQRRMHVFLYCNHVYTPNQWHACSFTRTRHALHTFMHYVRKVAALFARKKQRRLRTILVTGSHLIFSVKIGNNWNRSTNQRLRETQNWKYQSARREKWKSQS